MSSHITHTEKGKQYFCVCVSVVEVMLIVIKEDNVCQGIKQVITI